MRKILRVYVVSTTVCICLISLVVGSIIAKNNTRKLSFGEKYESVSLFSSYTDALIIRTSNHEYSLPNTIIDKANEIIIDLKPIYPAVINNFNWAIEVIEKAI